MSSKFTYGYLKEALKAHLDFEEDELEAMHINARFHIFANEAVQQMCYSKPKYAYYQATVVSLFRPLVYADGQLRPATTEEEYWEVHNLAEPTFADDKETTEWYNSQDIYLVGHEIEMPTNFLTFAAKKAYMLPSNSDSRISVTTQHITYVSNSAFIANYEGIYQIPYRGAWYKFANDLDDSATMDMPSDLLLTIPIYVASVILQQRDLDMARAKREEFELAVNRCRSSNVLQAPSISPTY